MSQINYPNVLITVGTTQFAELIDAINTPQTARVLLDQLGCTHLTVQFGAGKQPNLAPHYNDILTESYAYKSSILGDVYAADLVISHAGAGSITETLRARKPMVVVVNELLQDNHQSELAERMFADGHVLYCVPRTLADTLASLCSQQLRVYANGNAKLFAQQIDQLMGFE